MAEIKNLRKITILSDSTTVKFQYKFLSNFFFSLQTLKYETCP